MNPEISKNYQDQVRLQNTINYIPDCNGQFAPESVDELQEIVKWANRENKKLYPVSTGNNWGYGCHLPGEDDHYIVSLKKFNQISNYNPESGTITIGPGVTHGELSEFLVSKGDEWMTPVHGGGPFCSVVGNAIERGYGITPIMDHFQAIRSLKAVLGSGDLYSSALNSIGQVELSQIFKWGLGPHLDGIFTQSNYAIVTEMTIQLAVRPKDINLFFIDINSDEDFQRAVDAARRIKHKIGSNLGGINFLNTERSMSMFTRYPDELKKSSMPINEDDVKQIAKNSGIPKWSVFGAFYGPKSITKGIKKEVLKEFSQVKGRKVVLSESLFNPINSIIRRLKFLHNIPLIKKFLTLEEVFLILGGRPQKTALELSYWKSISNVKGPEMNPSIDDRGLIWYAPLVPMKSERAIEYVKMVREVSKRNNINALITLTTISENCFDSTIPILFNKNHGNEQEMAYKYFEELLEEGEKKGFFPYRFSTYHMKKLDDYKETDFFKSAKKLKQALDPNGVLSQGRYIR